MLALTEPKVRSLVSADDDPTHITCCDDQIAMCGLPVPDDQYEWDEDDGHDCRYCRYIEDEGLPCPVLGCPAGDE